MHRRLSHHLVRTAELALVVILTASLCGCGGAASPTTEAAAATAAQATPLPVATQPPAATPTLAPSPVPSATVCAPPAAPSLDPAGEVSVQPLAQLPIRASGTSATAYAWKLTGDGNLSSETGDVAIYTASGKSGGLATVSVTASNSCGAAPSVTLIIHIANVIVSLEKIGIPAGWMTSGSKDPAGFVAVQMISSGCESDHCYQFTYTPGNVYGGILWWPPSCGDTGTAAAWVKAKSGACAIQVFAQPGVTPQKLTFWARGEKGGEMIEFKVGAINIAPSPAESTGVVTLQQGWTQYEIPLMGMALDNATALFTWVAADIGNKEPAVFYLDSMQYEGQK